MNDLEEEFSSKCSIDDDNEFEHFDNTVPTLSDNLPHEHCQDKEREYLKVMLKTIDLWKMKMKKEKPDKKWVKFLFLQNEKMKYYQKYIQFDGNHETYDDLPNEHRNEITKIGKIISLTRTKICSKMIEPKITLLYLKKVYSGLSDIINTIQTKQSTDKSINMIIRKIKNI